MASNAIIPNKPNLNLRDRKVIGLAAGDMPGEAVRFEQLHNALTRTVSDTGGVVTNVELDEATQELTVTFGDAGSGAGFQRQGTDDIIIPVNGGVITTAGTQAFVNISTASITVTSSTTDFTTGWLEITADLTGLEALVATNTGDIAINTTAIGLNTAKVIPTVETTEGGDLVDLESITYIDDETLRFRDTAGTTRDFSGGGGVDSITVTGTDPEYTTTVTGDLDVEGTLEVNVITATDQPSALTAGSAGISHATVLGIGNGALTAVLSQAAGNAINAIVVDDDEELYATLQTDPIADEGVVTSTVFRLIFDEDDQEYANVGPTRSQIFFETPFSGGVAEPGQIETFQFFAAREVSADTITFVDDVEFLGDTTGVTAPADHYAFFTSETLEFEETIPVEETIGGVTTTTDVTTNYHADVAQVIPDIAIGRLDLTLLNTSGYVTISGFTAAEVSNIETGDSSTTTGRKYFGIHGIDSLGFAVITRAANQTNDGTSGGTANDPGTVTFHTFYRATNEGHESVEPDSGAALSPPIFVFGDRFQFAEFESIVRVDAIQEAIDDLNDNPLRYAIAITKPPGSLISWEESADADANTYIGNIDSFRRLEVSTTGTTILGLFQQITFDLITAGPEGYNDWITSDAGTEPRYIFLQGLTEFPIELIARIDTDASDAATTDALANDPDFPANGTTRVVATINNIRSLFELNNIATESLVSFGGITTLEDALFNVSELTDVRVDTIDQTYDATSALAQSGTAVAEAITEHVGIIEIAGSDNTFESTENYRFADRNEEFTFDFTTPDSATFSVDFTVETGFIGSFAGSQPNFAASNWTLGYRTADVNADGQTVSEWIAADSANTADNFVSTSAGTLPTTIDTAPQGSHTGNFSGTFTLTEAVTGIAQNTEYTFVLKPDVTAIVIGTAPEGYSIRVHETYAGAVQVRPGTREAIDDISDDRINAIRTSSTQLTFPDGTTFTGGGTSFDPTTLTGDITVTGLDVDIDDDTIGVAELSATGVTDATTFLRGDNTWATPAGGGGAVVITADNTNTNSTPVPEGGIAILSGTSNQYYNVSDEDIAVGVLADNTAAILYFENTNAGDWTRVGDAEDVAEAIEHITLESLANVTETAVTEVVTADFALRDTESSFLNVRGSSNIYLLGGAAASISPGNRIYPIIGGSISADLYTVVDSTVSDGDDTEVICSGTSQALINLVVAANRGGNPFTGFYFYPDTITGWHEEGSVTFEGQLLVRNTDDDNWETLNDLPTTITSRGGEIEIVPDIQDRNNWNISVTGEVTYKGSDPLFQAVDTGGVAPTINNIYVSPTQTFFYNRDDTYLRRVRIILDTASSDTENEPRYMLYVYAQNLMSGLLGNRDSMEWEGAGINVVDGVTSLGVTNLTLADARTNAQTLVDDAINNFTTT